MSEALTLFERIARAAKNVGQPSVTENRGVHPFDERNIHPEITGVSLKLFDNGHYSQATFEAFKYLDVQVKKLSGINDSGYKLMMAAFARTFAGASTRAIQREQWADTTGGTLQIDTPGKPSTLKGTITLRPEGSGTVEIVELEIKVRVPLIGGKIEKLLGEKVAAGMDAEHGVGIDYLAGR